MVGPQRGDIWWADLPEPKGSMPGYRHPIVIIQANDFNRSNLSTVVGVVITTNLRLANMPGNIEISPRQSGLMYDSVINTTQIVTANKIDLLEYVGALPESKMEQLERALSVVLDL
jgi:mRNA interferase MazF